MFKEPAAASIYLLSLQLLLFPTWFVPAIILIDSFPHAKEFWIAFDLLFFDLWIEYLGYFFI